MNIRSRMEESSQAAAQNHKDSDSRGSHARHAGHVGKTSHASQVLRQKFWFFLGLMAVLFMAVPYIVLGQDAIVAYHDQLDGEMIAYILQAKHLFAGDILPEFLGGADKTALTLPAPGFVLLFLTGNYFAALVMMQLAGSLCGYAGMYLLLKEAFQGRDETGSGRGQELIAVGVAVLYAYLPFLPVYGLSQYGIPLLVWSFLQLKKGGKHRIGCFLFIGVYTLCSSLVLVGFGVLLVGILWALWLQYGRKDRQCRADDGERAGDGGAEQSGARGQNAAAGKKAGARAVWGGLGLMLFLYIAENFRLLCQILAGGAVSHKTEYALAGESFFGGLMQGFLEGGQHSQDFHKWILAAAVLTAAAAFFTGAWKRKKERQLLVRMGLCVGMNFCFALGAALWNSGAGIALRTHLEAVGAFQVQRLLWLAPCFWYLLLGCVLLLAWRMYEGRGDSGIELQKLGKKYHTRRCGLGESICAGLCMAICAGAFCVTGLQVLLGSNLKPNLQKMRNPDYGVLSYRDYYAPEVMEQVENYIREYSGQEPSAYRVLSLGIDPAAALYQGFYCLDGYSNNYALDYKHAFRRILAPELEKSEYLREYFDEWGNRCYLLSAETPGYYTIEKNGFYFQNYELDTEAAKSLGADYILSAAYIANAKEQGLFLVREEPFESPGSYYRIFLYEIR